MAGLKHVVLLLGLVVIDAAAFKGVAKSTYNNGDMGYELDKGLLKLSGTVQDPTVPYYVELRIPHLSKTMTLSIPTTTQFIMPTTSVNGKCVRGENSMAIGVPLTGAEITLQCPWVEAEWFVSVSVGGVESKAKSVGVGMTLRVSDVASSNTFPAPPNRKDSTAFYLKVAICVMIIVSFSVLFGIACAVIQKRRADNVEIAARLRDLEARWMGYQRMTEEAPAAAAGTAGDVHQAHQVYVCPHGRVHHLSTPPRQNQLPLLQQPLFVD